MRQKGFTSAIALIVVILLGVLGYFAYTKGYINKLIGRNITQTYITPAPYPINMKPPNTPDSTADWKTFSHAEFKYQLKYPSNWTVVGISGIKPEDAPAVSLTSPREDYDNSGRSINIDISVEENADSNNLEAYTNKSPNDIISKKYIKIDGLDALEILYRNTASYIGHENEPGISVITILNKRILRIDYSEQSKIKITELKYESVFNQILSTFNFIQ